MRPFKIKNKYLLNSSKISYWTLPVSYSSIRFPTFLSFFFRHRLFDIFFLDKVTSLVTSFRNQIFFLESFCQGFKLLDILDFFVASFFCQYTLFRSISNCLFIFTWLGCSLATLIHFSCVRAVSNYI